jgi:hypothetical protein
VDASGGSADRGSRESPVKLLVARGPYQTTLSRSYSFEDRPTRLPRAYKSNPFRDSSRPVEIPRTNMQLKGDLTYPQTGVVPVAADRWRTLLASSTDSILHLNIPY